MTKRIKRKTQTRKSVAGSSSTQKKVSDGYVARRIPSGMTKIGVGSNGVEVYSATPQIVQQYYPDLYNLAPNADSYIFTGNNGVYTPVRQSDHTYDDVVEAHPIVKKVTNKKTSKQDKTNQKDVEPSTYGNGPAANPYNQNDPYLQEEASRQFWNDGGRDIWLKQADARAKVLTPTLGTFATLAWKPIEAFLPSNVIGTIGKQARDFNLLRLPADWLGSGFGGGNLGFTEISDTTANWAEKNPEANSTINLIGDLLLAPPVSKVVGEGFRAISPSTYIPGRAGTIADLGLFGGLAVKPIANAVENPTVGNIIVAGGSALPAVAPAFKTLRFASDILPRTYNTTEGNIFGSRFGNTVIGVDASGRNVYGTFVPPIKTGNLTGKPKYIEVFGADDGNIIPLDKVRQSIEYGVPLKYNGKTLKDVYLDETTGTIRAKFGGKDLTFYTEEPYYDVQDNVYVTNGPGRSTLGGDLPQGGSIEISRYQGDIPIVKINGKEYIGTDPNIQNTWVTYKDNGLDYSGELKDILPRISQPHGTPQTQLPEILRLDLEPIEEGGTLKDYFIDEADVIPGRKISLGGDISTIEGRTSDDPTLVKVTRGNSQMDLIRIRSKATQPIQEGQVVQTEEAILKPVNKEEVSTGETENTVDNEVTNEQNEGINTGEESDYYSDDNGFINTQESEDVVFRPSNSNTRVTNIKDAKGFENTMIESIVYKGKRMEVTRDGDVSILTDPNTNEEVTLTDVQVKALKKSGELSNPRYTESFEYYTDQNPARHPDDVWGGVRQDLPARIRKNRSKAGTVQKAYDYMHRPESKIPSWVYKVAAGIASTGGLTGLGIWLASGGKGTSYPIDPITGDSITPRYEDSVRNANRIIQKAYTTDTTYNTKNPEFSGEDQSMMGGQSNEISVGDSTRNYIEKGDTIFYDDGSFILKSDPSVLYK